MSRALPTKENLIGRHFGKLEVIGRSDKRGSRGARTVLLWECRCECGAICYKATDTLTNPDLSMCNECVGKYAGEKMREKAGFVDGLGSGIFAGGKTEYVIGKVVGNYNCNGTCNNNTVTGMTTSATENIGKIEASMTVTQ